MGLISVVNGGYLQRTEVELEEWRRGKRRVFWRVRWVHATIGPTYTDMSSRKRARKAMQRISSVRGSEPRLYRVTVRPKRKVQP